MRRFAAGENLVLVGQSCVELRDRPGLLFFEGRVELCLLLAVRHLLGNDLALLAAGIELQESAFDLSHSLVREHQRRRIVLDGCAAGILPLAPLGERVARGGSFISRRGTGEGVQGLLR